MYEEDIINAMDKGGIDGLNRRIAAVAEAAAVKRQPRRRPTSTGWATLANTLDNTWYQDVTDNFM